MKIRILKTIEELKLIEQEWDALRSQQVRTSPFQTFIYNLIWWSTLGGGEWHDAELWVFTAYDDHEHLMGIAPLFKTEVDGPELRFIGSVEISDYLDFLVEPEKLNDFIRTLLEEITSGQVVDRLVLDNLLEDAPVLPILHKTAEAMGLKVIQERSEPAPLLILPGSIEQYFEGLESKQRKEFKRKMRRAAEYPARVSWRIVDLREALVKEIEVFLELMGNDTEKRAFLTDPMKDHFRQLASEADWLQLAFLEVSGEPVFGYLNFIAQDRVWVYNSGFNPDHFALSPGWVLMGYLIEWAIEKGFEAVDFMRGDEQYKYRLGGTDRFVCRLTIETSAN